MMEFPPPGNGSDLCAGLEVALLMRPRPPEWMATFHLVIMYGFLTAVVVSHVVWFFLRDLPHLQVRSVFLVAAVNVGAVLGTMAVAGKRMTVDPQTMLPNFPCLALAFAWLMTSPTNMSAFFVRMFRIMAESQFATIALLYQKQAIIADDLARMSGEAGQTSLSLASKDTWFAPCAFVARTIELIIEGLKTPPSKDLVDTQVLEKRLEILSFAHRPWVTTVMFLILNAPNVILFVIIFTASDVYRGNCLGCDLYWDVFLAFMIFGMLLANIMFRLFYLLRNEHDKYGQVRELMLALALCDTFMSIGFLLLIIDPLQVDYDNHFLFEWVVLLGFWSLWFVSTPLQIWIALKHRSQSSEVAATLTVDFATAMKDPAMQAQFEKWAVQFMVVESFRFVSDVLSWKGFFYERSPEWRLAKARHLVKVYIEQRAVMQINVSSDDRISLETMVQAGNVDFTMFDEAVKSVSKMLSVPGAAFYEFAMSEVRQTSTPAQANKMNTAALSGQSLHRILSKGDLRAVRSSSRLQQAVKVQQV